MTVWLSHHMKPLVHVLKESWYLRKNLTACYSCIVFYIILFMIISNMEHAEEKMKFLLVPTISLDHIFPYFSVFRVIAMYSYYTQNILSYLFY